MNFGIWGLIPAFILWRDYSQYSSLQSPPPDGLVSGFWLSQLLLLVFLELPELPDDFPELLELPDDFPEELELELDFPELLELLEEPVFLLVELDFSELLELPLEPLDFPEDTAAP